MIFLLPLTLKRFNSNRAESNDDLKVIVMSSISSIPSVLFATLIVNIRIFGRKYSLALAYSFTAIIGILIYLTSMSESVNM